MNWGRQGEERNDDDEMNDVSTNEIGQVQGVTEMTKTRGESKKLLVDEDNDEDEDDDDNEESELEKPWTNEKRKLCNENTKLK